VAVEASVPDGTLHAAVYSFIGGGLTELDTIGSDAHPFGINRSDVVVGYYLLEDFSAEHAFVRDGDSIRDIGTLGGDNSHAFAINDRGTIVGDAEDEEFNTVPAVWRAGADEPVALPGLGGPFGGATAINNAGKIVGYSAIEGDFPPPEFVPDHAFLYDPATDTTTDLGTLPGELTSEAFGINSRGWVAGVSGSPTGPSHAFLYRNGQMRDLGTLEGGQSFGAAINDDGLVVGDSLVDAGEHHAFVYDTAMRDLNDRINPASGWTLEFATGINGAGMITGVGVIDGEEHGFLLTPVRPAPQVRVTGFTLVNASNGRVLRRLANGDTLDLATLPRRVNVVATLSGGRVGSVVFGLDGNGRFHVERAAPFTLFGDVNGRFLGGTFSRGRHTLTARAFGQENGTGPLGPVFSVTFTVVDSRRR
jgi:probable HAF family extracellular repeat protein